MKNIRSFYKITMKDIRSFYKITMKANRSFYKITMKAIISFYKITMKAIRSFYKIISGQTAMSVGRLQHILHLNNGTLAHSQINIEKTEISMIGGVKIIYHCTSIYHIIQYMYIVRKKRQCTSACIRTIMFLDQGFTVLQCKMTKNYPTLLHSALTYSLYIFTTDKNVNGLMYNILYIILHMPVIIFARDRNCI